MEPIGKDLNSALTEVRANARGKAIVRVAEQLVSADGGVVLAASALSGKYGLLVLTPHRLAFIWKSGLVVQTGDYPFGQIRSVAVEGTAFVIDTDQRLSFTEVSPPERAAAIAEFIHDQGVDWLDVSNAPDQSALRILGERSRNAALQHMGAHETVHVCLATGKGQGLVALEDRLLIVKSGMVAGSTFGANVTAYDYRQIIGLEVQTNMTTALLVVQTANSPTPGSYWSNDKSSDPWKLPNCLPAAKKSAQEWAPYLEQVRQLVAAARDPKPVLQTAPAGGDLATALERLHGLHTSGALSDEEFQKAKAQLLDG